MKRMGIRKFNRSMYSVLKENGVEPLMVEKYGKSQFLIIPFLEFYIHSDVGIHNSNYKLYAARLPFYIFVFQFFPVLIQSSLNNSAQYILQVFQ